MQSLPSTILLNQKIVHNDWLLVDESVEASLFSELQGRNILVPLCCWQSEQEYLNQRRGLTGVWLNSSQRAADLLVERTVNINTIPLIALYFPIFTDGRNYSNARSLRQALGYQGDLMAFGDVLRDQACFMSRCGINALAPRADQNLNDMIVAINDFADAYQATITQPMPLFRRRDGA